MMGALTASMSLGDWVNTAMAVIGVLGGLFGALNRWATANKRDRLAIITSAAGNAAGRVNQIIAGIPVSATAATTKATLIREAAIAINNEFGASSKPAGATIEKIAGIIEGQFGQLPAPAASLIANGENAVSVAEAARALDVVPNVRITPQAAA